MVNTWRPANRLFFEADDSYSPPRVVEAHIQVVHPIEIFDGDEPDSMFAPISYFQADHAHVVTEWQAGMFEDAEVTGIEFGEVTVEVAPWEQDAETFDIPDLALMRVLGTAFVEAGHVQNACCNGVTVFRYCCRSLQSNSLYLSHRVG
ncbi:hypothetical protein [Nocardia sp. NPDC005366]|uniref:hypothetical protein n=1 Tax=Nocardia sp. NPDC005366 TaxID=3156878 RepID=UPI0033B5F2A8